MMGTKGKQVLDIGGDQRCLILLRDMSGKEQERPLDVIVDCC